MVDAAVLLCSQGSAIAAQGYKDGRNGKHCLPNMELDNDSYMRVHFRNRDTLQGTYAFAHLLHRVYNHHIPMRAERTSVFLNDKRLLPTKVQPFIIY